MVKMKGLQTAALLLALGAAIPAGQAEAASVASAAADALGGGSAGRQLQDMQEQLERARVEQEMQEHFEKEKTGVEDKQTTPDNQAGRVTFVLREVRVDASEVLPEEKRDAIVAPYLNREITLEDLYKLVQDINAFYAEGHYMTCRAYLPEQTIHNGVVRIALIEGRNGKVTLTGNRFTRDNYILDRVPVEEGRVESLDRMTERLRHFNGTNDVQLHVTLKAGEEPGTTDFVITAREPKNELFTLYGDNAGNESTGTYRMGIFYANRSVFGHRDAFNVGYLHTKGMDSFNTGYSIPLGRSGTRLAASYSTNATEVIKGPFHDVGVKMDGHAASYGATLTQPLLVSDTAKVEASFGWQNLHSKTDLSYDGTEVEQLINDRFTDYTAALAATFYGHRRAFYQRHAFTHGKWKNGSPAERLAKPSASYNIYNFNGIYQQSAAHGQLFTLRTNLQWSATRDLRPSKQFFLGGAYSVRGYKENAVGADSGFTASLEYSVPVLRNQALSAYGFFDYGKLWGGYVPQHHILAGTGVGLRSKFKDLNVDLCLAFPLRRQLDGEKVSKTRLHFTASLQF